MIERLSGRRGFDRLRAEGQRRGRGPIRLLIRPDTTQSARFAFAIPRSVGNAVVRNRIKRRLRAVLSELDASAPGLAGGDHLLRVTAPIEHWSHATLRSTMAELLSTHAEPAGSGSSGEDRR
jgi:ribonuclease P protein component